MISYSFATTSSTQSRNMKVVGMTLACMRYISSGSRDVEFESSGTRLNVYMMWCGVVWCGVEEESGEEEGASYRDKLHSFAKILCHYSVLRNHVIPTYLHRDHAPSLVIEYYHLHQSIYIEQQQKKPFLIVSHIFYKISVGNTTTQFLSAVTSLPLAICSFVLFLISSCSFSYTASVRLIHR
ncbi:hypothetical protein GMOD_00001695 [Pyrenophora seminiperda CCB06]|uniref:Uncharacterized protein n=1 Tax=Pyrenophora seminiperda CCB06 TaxID=1302712 RepID=A0A3M7LVY1_9PLEO|nr:hypothetical protein GMOD_00001695 [Pyrenophora seminiperda CCB06]